MSDWSSSGMDHSGRTSSRESASSASATGSGSRETTGMSCPGCRRSSVSRCGERVAGPLPVLCSRRGRFLAGADMVSMSRTFFYYHRLDFPSSSGQTIQVLRDYHALALRGHAVHAVYRSRTPLGTAELEAALKTYGLAVTPGFDIHALTSGWAGRRHM